MRETGRILPEQMSRRAALGLLIGGATGLALNRSGLLIPSQEIELTSFQTLPDAIVDSKYENLSFNNEGAHIDFNDPAFNPLLKRLMDESHHQLLIDCINHHPKYEKRYHPTDPLKISDHFTWNAVDIGMVDGELVSPTSEKSRAYVKALLALPDTDSRKPTRIISPFGDLTETNDDHKTHIHVANTHRPVIKKKPVAQKPPTPAHR